MFACQRAALVLALALGQCNAFTLTFADPFMALSLMIATVARFRDWWCNGLFASYL
jgi:hypothetical protein